MARSSAAAAALLLLLLALSLRPAAAVYPEITAFGRRAWMGNLNLLGSASIVHGREPTLAVTSDGVGAGRALFPYPVRFLLPPRDRRTSPAQASFSTRFTIRIVPSPTYGDGMAFVMTSSRTFLGSAEGYMGIYAAGPAASDIANVTTVAVELDTRHDVALGDIDGNHVGLDTGSIFSVASATPAVDLKAGRPVTAWVDYNGPRRRLRVWLSFSSSRAHLDPTLSLSIDLSKLVGEWMYIGFSAANTQGGAARHLVESWSFRTLWDRNTRQRHAPPPPSPSSPLPTPPPPPPVPASPPQHHHHKLKTAIAVLVAIVLFVLLMGTLLLLLRRRRKKKVGGSVELSALSEFKAFLAKDMERSA